MKNIKPMEDRVIMVKITRFLKLPYQIYKLFIKIITPILEKKHNFYQTIEKTNLVFGFGFGTHDHMHRDRMNDAMWMKHGGRPSTCWTMQVKIGGAP